MTFRLLYRLCNLSGLLAIALIALSSLHLLAQQASAAKATQPWLGLRDQRLVYHADVDGNHIPDFSTVGYQAGDSPIPRVAVRVRVEAEPGDADDTARIQQAIATVAALPVGDDGFRGTVLLGPGEFRIAGTLKINVSGVVLRGSGTEGGGTHLRALGSPRRLVWIQGAGEWAPLGARKNIMDAIVPVGASAVTVDATTGDFRVGDRVIVQWNMTPAFIHSIDMDRIPPRKDGREVAQWTTSMGLHFDRKILAVMPVAHGVRLQLNSDLTQEMRLADGATVWRYGFPGRINHVGIEDLSADGLAFEKAPGFTQPIDPPERRDQPSTPHREDGSFFSSIFTDWEAVEDGWMRHIYVEHFNNIVVVDAHARALTFSGITANRVDTPPKRNHAAPFAYQVDGQQVLCEHCNVGGRLNHVWATQARVAGPNVFRDSIARGFDLDAGPHHRWATGVLYEQLTLEGRFDAYNQEGLGTGHGWAGAYNVFYNDIAADWQVESPPGAYIWVIGSRGPLEKPQHGSPGAYLQSHGTPVLPASLYLQQLKERHAAASATQHSDPKATAPN